MKHVTKYLEENRPESAAPRRGDAGFPEIDWNSRLDTGEELLWTGRPEPGGAMTIGPGLDPSGRWIISVICLGIIGFLLYRVLPEVWNYPLIMLPIAAMVAVMGFGLWYLLGGQEPWARYWLFRTRYALTDRRAIIARRIFGRHWSISYPFKRMTLVRLVEQGALGRVIFRDISVENYSTISHWFTSSRTHHAIGFHFLRDAGTVHRRLLALQSEPAGANVADGPAGG